MLNRSYSLLNLLPLTLPLPLPLPLSPTRRRHSSARAPCPSGCSPARRACRGRAPRRRTRTSMRTGASGSARSRAQFRAFPPVIPQFHPPFSAKLRSVVERAEKVRAERCSGTTRTRVAVLHERPLGAARQQRLCLSASAAPHVTQRAAEVASADGQHER